MRHWTHVAVAICALSAAADEGMTTWGSLEVFHPVQGFDAPVRSISAGRSHNTVLLEDGSLVGWGRNNLLQAKVEEVPSACHQIASGYDHNVALLTDGSIFCWGDNTYGKCEPPAGNNFIQVDAGQDHSIALRVDGTIACWGDPIYCDAPLDDDFVSIHAGGDFSIGLKSNGIAVGWGPGVGKEIPEDVISWMQIDAGSNHGIGLLPTGEARCWGGNSDGQLDVPEGHRFVQVAAGHNHSMGLKVDGSVICWGGSDAPVCDVPDEQFALIAGGDQHSLGLTRAGEVLAWGENIYGQTSVPAGAPVKSVAARGGFVAVVQADGQMFIFGPPSGNSNGYFDIPDRDFLQVDFGINFLVGLTEEKDLVCWGNFPSPPDLNNVVSVSAGLYHVAALLSDGTVALWGSNTSQQLELTSEIFTQVSAGNVHTAGVGADNAVYVNHNYCCAGPSPNDYIYSRVASGNQFFLALTLDGRVEAYGQDTSGVVSNSPQGVGFVDIDAGRYHAAAIHEDGSVALWGSPGGFSSAPSELNSEQSIYLGEDITVILDVVDCDQNGISDIEEIIAGTGVDLNTNWVLDVCDPDCDQDGVPDFAAIENGAFDCNVNQIPDSCEAGDDNQNGFLDACEVDCNLNGVIDFLDLIGGQAQDQNSNGVPDECDPDCDQDGLPDDVDDQPDCDGDGIPDACDAEGDCDGSGIPDFCEGAFDCNANGIADSCDIATGPSSDVNGDQIPDDCQCVADVNQDAVVNFADLLQILGDFGICPKKGPCSSDINANGSVDYQDLIRVLSLWGSCG